MSQAKTLQHVASVRNAQNKRNVYKNVVNSPFILKWPVILPELGQQVMAELQKTLHPVGEYKKQCHALKKANKKIKKKSSDKATLMNIDLKEPDLNRRIHIGINEVTRFLETYIQNKQQQQKPQSEFTPVIYICKREIKPLQLCQHILYMATLAKIKLVPLPQNAEIELGHILGTKRASVILLQIVENKEESLRLTAKQIPTIEAPWLNNNSDATLKMYYVGDDKLTTKVLKTTAPANKQQHQIEQKEKKQNLKRKALEDHPQEQHMKKSKC